MEYRVEIITEGRSEESDAAIRIIYMVEGCSSFTVGKKETKLCKTDIVLLNKGAGYQLRLKKDAIAAVISLDYYELCALFGMESVLFQVDSTTQSGQKYTELKALIQRLLLAYVSTGETKRIRQQSAVYLLLEALGTHFIDIEELYLRKEREGVSQIAEIIRYVHENYRMSVSLNEIAERMFLSPSWVSRIFLRETGEHFADYVKKLRLEHVKEELENTDHSITQIAMDNGFSNPSALNRSFKSEFQITPTEYREKRKSRNRRKKAQEAEDKERLLRVLASDRLLSIEEQERQVALPVEVSEMQPWKKWEGRVLNVGAVHQLSSGSLQKQILFLAGRLDIEYLRMWNLFSPKMMIFGGRKGEYNFSFVDEILDFCVDNKMKVYIDLAQRKDVAMASERQEIYSHEEFTEFEDEASWLDALRSFLVHIRNRYHEKTVGEWIFELTFFLNDKPYYRSGHYNILTVWVNSYELIKSILPSAKVAGPGLIADSDRRNLRKTMKRFLSAKHHPDFFTSILFPYVSDRKEESESIYQADYKKASSVKFLEEEAMVIKEELEKLHYDGEYWVTDWGNSLANRNIIQDSCFRASFIVGNILRNCEKVDVMGIFYASDRINQYSDSSSLLTGSSGLLSRNGIAKPAYYAYLFLTRLGKYRILQTDHCIVTAEHLGDIRILCYNYKSLGPRYYLKEENSHMPDELDQLFVDLDRCCMELIVRYPQDETALIVRQETLNAEKGSILDKWIRFGCSESVSRSDMEFLERTSIPEITAERVVPLDRAIQISVQMEPNEIRMITITRE